MLIIKIEAQDSGQHLIQSQSHREECWLEGWVTVPSDRESDVLSCKGYGDLTVEEGVFVDFAPRPDLIPVPEEPEAEPETEGDTAVWDEMAAAIEEGVNEV